MFTQGAKRSRSGADEIAERGVPPRARLSLRREWTAAYRGHDIRIVCTWTWRAELVIDGGRIDRRWPLLASDPEVPLLTGQLPSTHSRPMLVEVYVRSPLVLSASLRIDGRRVECAPCAECPHARPLAARSLARPT